MSNLTPGHNQKNKKRRKKIIFWFFISLFLVLSTFTVLLLAQNNEPNSYVKVNEAYYILNEGESTLVTFEASQDLGAFTYTSNDTSVVQFIENRLITVGTGSTTITVSSQSNPSIFQTVSVIVRERVIEPNVPEVPVEPEVPVDPEGPVEPEPELPEEPVNPEPEVPVDPEPEVPVDPDDESVVTPPTIYTITITNETGAVITTLELEEGSFITTSGLDLPETFKGFYFEGETCTDEPFDLETPITENVTLIQASFNDQAPCLQLDYIVLSGKPIAGTELTVDIFPLGANVTISWYTSVNNRTYREITGESGSTFTVRPEDSGKFIRVYVVSDSNPPVVRYDTIKLDVFGTVSDGGGSQGGSSSACTVFTDINSTSDFINMTPNGCYKLTSNIDLSGLNILSQSALNFTFQGTLDGDNYTIENLSISSAVIQVGLFSKLDGATIKNLTLSAFNITGSNYVGGIAGFAESTNISNINLVRSNINASLFTGGLVGYSTNSAILNSTFDGTVSGSTDQVGGLVGYSFNSAILNSTSNGTVSGLNSVGGLVGQSQYSIISNSAFDGTVSGRFSVGGLVGVLRFESIIESSFNTGLVISTKLTSGLAYSGGLAGYMNHSSQILNSYNTGNVSSSGQRVGGIVGVVSDGTAENPNLIFNSYSASNVTGSGIVGGVLGFIFDTTPVTFTDVFWNTDIGSLSNGTEIQYLSCYKWFNHRNYIH